MSDPNLLQYLKHVDRLAEPGFVFSPTLDVDAVLATVEAGFPGRPVFALRATGLIPPKADEVAQTFRNSFEGQGVLAVVVDDKMPDPVKHAVERICKDGYLPQEGQKGWEPLKPPPDWRMVVLARVRDPSTLPGDLATLFGARYALGDG